MNDKILIFKYIVNNDVSKLDELLKSNKNLLYATGQNLQLPIHDACFYGNKDTISLLVKYDNKILNKVNNNGMNGYQILSYHPKLLIYFMKKYKPEDIHHVNIFNHTILVCYILNSNNLEEEILKELKDLGCSLLKPDDINGIIYILEKSCDNLDLIKKYFKFDLNRVDKNDDLISFQLVDTNNLNCLKKLIKLGLDINTTNQNGTLISYVIVKNNIEFIEFLLTQNIDFSYTNNFENNYFNLILMTNTINLDFQKIFLKNIIDINKQNIEGNTILHYIFIKNRWDDFKDILLNKKVDITIKNKFNKTPLDYVKKNDRLKIKKVLNNLIKIPEVEVNLLNYKTPHHTSYISYIWSYVASAHYLIKKYDNVGIPICKNLSEKDKNDILTNNYGDNITPNCFECSKILYTSKDNYYISNNLESCIKNVLNKEFIFIGISIHFTNGGSHASILIIDNNRREIERFETYGIYYSKYETDLDNILQRKVTKIMKNLTRKQYKYKAPKDYQSLFDFQNIGEKWFKKYTNEIGGFCQAWVFWYLEHKLLNPKLDSKELVLKLKNKLLQDKRDIIDHIRAYANKLDKYTTNLLIKYKIKKNNIYNLQNNRSDVFNFLDKIIVDLLKIQNIE